MEFDATFIVSIISFVFFVLIMNKIFYKPILDIIEARENFYKKNNENLELNNQKTKDLEDRTNEKILSAKSESQKIIQDGIRRAKDTKEEIIKSNKNSINKEEEDEFLRLNNEANSAREELNKNIQEISNLIVSKFLEGENKNV